MTNERKVLNVTIGLTRAKAMGKEGITVWKSAARHEFKWNVTVSLDDLGDLLLPSDINTIAGIAIIDLQRGYEAGHLPVPTFPDDGIHDNKISWSGQTRQHAEVIANVIMNIIQKKQERRGIITPAHLVDTGEL